MTNVPTASASTVAAESSGETSIDYFSRVLDVRWIAALPLAIAGFYFMFDGLTELFTGSVVWPLSISISIQTLAIYSIRKIKGYKNISSSYYMGKNQVILGAISYLLCVVLTAGFSYGSLYRNLQASNIAESQFTDIKSNVLNSSQNLLLKLNNLKSLLDNASAHATTQAKREQNIGNSCSGLSSGSSRGDITIFRESDAIAFETQSTLINNLLKSSITAFDLVKGMAFSSTATSSDFNSTKEKFRTSISEFNAIANNPATSADLKKFTSELITIGNALPRLGKPCEDVTRSRFLSAIEIAADELGSIAKIDQPSLIDPANTRDLTFRSFNVIAAILTHPFYFDQRKKTTPPGIIGVDPQFFGFGYKGAANTLVLLPGLFPLVLVVIFECLLFALTPGKTSDPALEMAFKKVFPNVDNKVGFFRVLWLLASTPTGHPSGTSIKSNQPSFDAKFSVLAKHLVLTTSFSYVLIPNADAFRVSRLVAQLLVMEGYLKCLNSSHKFDKLPQEIQLGLGTSSTGGVVSQHYAVYDASPAFVGWVCSVEG